MDTPLEHTAIPMAPTPGPWRIFWARGNTHLFIGIGELNGEGVTDCGFGVWRGGSYEAAANARLIAAAPEMLAALKALAHSDNAPLVLSDAWSLKLLDDVRAAIAKAEGTSP